MYQYNNPPEELNQELFTKLDQIQKAVAEREKPFLSFEQAAEYLGISKATLYGYTHQNVLPFYKVQGRRVYFKVDDLNDFILNDKNRRKSAKEIEQAAATRLVVNKK